MIALLKTLDSAAHLLVIVNLPEEEISAAFVILVALLKYGSTTCAAANAENVEIAIIKAKATQKTLLMILFRIFSPLLPHLAHTTL